MKSSLKISITALAMGFLAVGQLVAEDLMMEKLKAVKGEEFDHTFVSQMIAHHQQGSAMASLAQERAERSEIKQFAKKTADLQQKDIEELKGLQAKSGSQHASTTNHRSGAAGVARVDETKGIHTGATSTDKKAHPGGTSHASTMPQVGAGAPTGRTSHEGSSHEAMMGETMTKLHAAQGAEFDRVFTAEMIMHHNMAIEMSELAKSRASSSEVKKFAQKSIDDQKEEVAELKSFGGGSR